MATKKTSEAKVQEVQAQEAKLTLEQYVQRAKVNPGTVASFKYEAKKAGDDLSPRTKQEWEQAIKAQEQKVYK